MSVRTEILLSEDERGFAEKEAANLGMSLSGYMRHLLHERVALAGISDAMKSELEDHRLLLQADLQIQQDEMMSAQRANFKQLVEYLNQVLSKQ